MHPVPYYGVKGCFTRAAIAPMPMQQPSPQADALGIFGREGVDLAFRMYRNYDGAGSGFGETSVQASGTDQGRLAIYAAERASDGALTLMVINKTGEPLTSSLTLSNASPEATARVYRYSAANLGTIVREADQPVTSSGFTATYPANSITLIVL